MSEYLQSELPANAELVEIGGKNSFVV